jgi:hypothetical protein
VVNRLAIVPTARGEATNISFVDIEGSGRRCRKSSRLASSAGRSSARRKGPLDIPSRIAMHRIPSCKTLVCTMVDIIVDNAAPSLIGGG